MPESLSWDFNLLSLKTSPVLTAILLALALSCLATAPKARTGSAFLYLWGSPATSEHSNAMATVGDRWGIEFRSIPHPNVTGLFLRHVERHNAKARRQLVKWHGADWEERFDAEVDSEVVTQQAVRALVHGQPYVSHPDSSLQTGGELECYLTAIVEDSLYAVEVYAKPFPENEDAAATTFYRLRVDLQMQKVTMESDRREPFTVEPYIKMQWYKLAAYAR